LYGKLTKSKTRQDLEGKNLIESIASLCAHKSIKASVHSVRHHHSLCFQLRHVMLFALLQIRMARHDIWRTGDAVLTWIGVESTQHIIVHHYP
jgi:hypothetical protein